MWFNMQHSAIELTACSRGDDFTLSDFVDSLLNVDGSMYALVCSGANDTTKAGAHGLMQATVATADVTCLDLPIVESPATPAVLTSRGQRKPCKHQRNRQCCGRTTKRRNRLVKVVRRTISNDTYLRRVYLSPEQALCLFPGLQPFSATATMARQVRASLRSKVTTQDVVLVTRDGRRWSSVFECVVSTNGQLHCRLVNGWSQFCKDNGVAVHDSVVLESSSTNSNEIVAIVERKAG